MPYFPPVHKRYHIRTFLSIIFLLYVTLYYYFCYTYTMTMNRLLIALAVVLLFAACQTTVTISEDMSPAQIIQRAHEAMDRNRYNIAIQYYQALYDRNRTNIDLVITAEYHIAHIHYRQGRLEQAREGMVGVLAYYYTPGAILLPQHFRVLAEIVLENIEERETHGKRPRRK